MVAVTVTATATPRATATATATNPSSPTAPVTLGAPHSGFAYGGNGNVYAFETGTQWDEDTLTWNNQPAPIGDELGFWWLWYNNSPADRTGQIRTPELMAAVEANLDEQAIAFRLHSPGYRTNDYSRDNGEFPQRPQLRIVYDTPED